MKNLFNICISVVLFAIVFLFNISFAGDGELYFYHNGNLKAYCWETVGVKFSKNYQNTQRTKYDGIATYILFDSGNVSLEEGNLGYLQKWRDTPNPYLGNKLYVESAFTSPLYGDNQLFSISIKSNTGITSTELKFVNKLGVQQVDSEGLKVTNPGDSTNILQSVVDKTYIFYAHPCTGDNKSPILKDNRLYKKGENVYVNGKNHILTGQKLSFVVYDWDASNKVSRWLSGTYDTGDIDKYLLAPNNVDNQMGVDSSTIKVFVKCDTCSSLSGKNGVWLTGKLNIDPREGTSSINSKTWNGYDRGYTVRFDAPFDYEIEKEVKVTIYASDNADEDGNPHTFNNAANPIKFNTKQDPIITLVKPAPLDTKVDGFDATDVPPSKTNSIVIGLSDEWAGINTGSVEINISYPVLSGDAENVEYVMTGYSLTKFDFSEDAFSIISGQPGTGNAGSYNLTFYPLENFTVNTGITIVVTGKDLAGNIKSQTFKIRTMDSCEAYGCSDLFYVWTGLLDSKWGFTGGVLQITGDRLESPYPYFESTDSGLVLMCGKDWDDITISTSDGALVDGLINQGDGYKYTGSELYITGLNYEISGNVIIVSDD